MNHNENVDEGERLIARLVDASLWATIYMADLMVPSLSTNSPAFRASSAADEFLKHYNFVSLKQALKNARKMKLVKPLGRGKTAPPEITEAGKKRLATFIPQYDSKRPWDNKIHIITYDIPESHKKDRDILRDYLRRIGCGRMQDSVWITPYNPLDLIRTFNKDYDLAGTIIVSDMGDNGSIGEEEITDLLVRIYSLEKINDRYEEWIAEVKKQKVLTHWFVLSYLSILKDDPQLPFPLLPDWWQGDKAYRLVEPKLNELSKKLSPQK